MKKLLLLALVALGGVMNVSADDYLPGSWNDWKRDDVSKFNYPNGSGIGTLTLNLSANTSYTFGLDNGGNWLANGGVMCFNNCTGWTFGSGESNCTIYTTIAGDYTFTITWSGSTPSISVTYPGTYDDVVYFCNTVNWAKPYAYILHSSYWDESTGSGSMKQPNGIEMKNISGTNVWKAEFPTGARSSYIAFTKDKQDGYGNFYATEAVYKTDFPTSGSYVYVPSATSSGSLNSVDYFNNGEWYSYPTYNRSVTAGNFGTICLPFAATVTGATVYKIVSTVGTGASMTGVNLESVENLEAGHAYIFKATGSTLTATYSGAYADATEANGMLGNLSSTPVTVDAGNYVVSGNKICPVGENVTIGQNRAYITLNGIGVAASRGANFIGFDEATGIDNIKAENGQEVVYNLQGQRVTDAQKGLVIMGGKKMLRK